MKHIRIVLITANGREHVDEDHTKDINAYFNETVNEYTVIRTDFCYYAPPINGSLEISLAD